MGGRRPSSRRHRESRHARSFPHPPPLSATRSRAEERVKESERQSACIERGRGQINIVTPDLIRGPSPVLSAGADGSVSSRTAAAGATGQGWTPDQVRGDGLGYTKGCFPPNGRRKTRQIRFLSHALKRRSLGAEVRLANAPKKRPGAPPPDPGAKEVKTQGASVRATRNPPLRPRIPESPPRR